MVDFNETSAKILYDTLIKDLERNVKEPLYPGDERRIFGEAFVAVFVGIYNTLNDTARQKMLRYARGDVLDALGERTDTYRLMPSSAKTIMRFHVSAPQFKNISIPQGTRVTPDGEIFFTTDISAILQSNMFYVDIPVSSSIGGSICNDFLPGSINVLVDLIPYIKNVENLEKTYGGDDGETYTKEGDERYRERIKISSSKFSTAGPVGAYEYWTMSADPNIIDVKVISPEPGKVTIIPLMQNGTLPNEETIQKILNIVNQDIRRPLTDLVTVEKPKEVYYDIEIKYYVSQKDENAIVNTIENTNGSIDRYNKWQTNKLGLDINPDQFRRFILSPNWSDDVVGAIRVDIVSPQFVELNEFSIAKFSGTLITSHKVVDW